MYLPDPSPGRGRGSAGGPGMLKGLSGAGTEDTKGMRTANRKRKRLWREMGAIFAVGLSMGERGQEIYGYKKIR